MSAGKARPCQNTGETRDTLIHEQADSRNGARNRKKNQCEWENRGLRCLRLFCRKCGRFVAPMLKKAQICSFCFSYAENIDGVTKTLTIVKVHNNIKMYTVAQQKLRQKDFG